ncbi:MAG: signal peptidase II [Clostridia bacterium]|nr:signal peptidase II [Clostridia bacterium]
MTLWLIIIAAAVILDQATKFIAASLLDINECVVAIPYLFNFHHIKNTGAAWGMFSDNRWVFLVISFAAIIALPIFLYKYRKAPFLFGFSLSLIIGGAIGNMLDRLFAPNGGVTDFIEFAFMDFPIFNVADIFVCIGAVLIFIYLAFMDKVIFPPDPKKEKETAPAEQAEETEQKEENDDEH